MLSSLAVMVPVAAAGSLGTPGTPAGRSRRALANGRGPAGDRVDERDLPGFPGSPHGHGLPGQWGIGQSGGAHRTSRNHPKRTLSWPITPPFTPAESTHEIGPEPV